MVRTKKVHITLKVLNSPIIYNYRINVKFKDRYTFHTLLRRISSVSMAKFDAKLKSIEFIRNNNRVSSLLIGFSIAHIILHKWNGNNPLLEVLRNDFAQAQNKPLIDLTVDEAKQSDTKQAKLEDPKQSNTVHAEQDIQEAKKGNDFVEGSNYITKRIKFVLKTTNSSVVYESELFVKFNKDTHFVWDLISKISDITKQSFNNKVKVCILSPNFTKLKFIGTLVITFHWWGGNNPVLAKLKEAIRVANQRGMVDLTSFSLTEQTKQAKQGEAGDLKQSNVVTEQAEQTYPVQSKTAYKLTTGSYHEYKGVVYVGKKKEDLRKIMLIDELSSHLGPHLAKHTKEIIDAHARAALIVNTRLTRGF